MGALLGAGNIQSAVMLAFEVLTAMVTLATVVTALTPTQWDNELVNQISKILNMIAGNVGHNRNADDG
ncbi:MAG: hypothetical protein EP348_07270 [Alphaproteobacteria bacterium]|nr:MAG: hypothetical protein EP348_07270 [Alphaproteobacteria bacterium]